MPEERSFRLQPIAMVRPNGQGIYAPSRIRSIKEMSESEFFERYFSNGQPRAIQVSFEEDGLSNPQLVTAYGYGLDCWYIEV